MHSTNYPPNVAVKMREWIGPAPFTPDFVLVADRGRENNKLCGVCGADFTDFTQKRRDGT